MTVGANVQPAIVGVPVSSIAPGAYVAGSDVVTMLAARWEEFSLPSCSDGIALAASMAVDEEGPFFGVKLLVTQEREWPRTFRYGWPNMVATPSPVLVTEQRPGIFFLDYEGVVPQQIVDWVCLEAYRMATSRPLVEVDSESVTGASVKYNHWTGAKGSVPAQIDRIQAALISPFQMPTAHESPFINFSQT